MANLKKNTPTKKLRLDETQESVEEWSAMIAQMQDSGNDPKWRKKGTNLEQTTNKTGQRPQVTELTVDDYQKHWIESTDTGWQIRIATDTQKIIINCNFPDKIRGKDGRLTSI